MENSLTQSNNTLSFDNLRQTDEYGKEYWSGRDLQSPFGYTKWENFEEAIEKAIISRKNIGQDPSHWVLEVRKPIISGKGRKQEVKDYRLTRPGAYLVAMNCDPRKPEIAAAQNYFVAKTLEAELTIAQGNTIDFWTVAKNPQLRRQKIELNEDIMLSLRKETNCLKYIEEQENPELVFTRGKRRTPRVITISNGVRVVQLQLCFEHRIGG